MSWFEGRGFRVRPKGSRSFCWLDDLRKLFHPFCLPLPRTEALEGQTMGLWTYTAVAKNQWKILTGSGTGG